MFSTIKIRRVLLMVVLGYLSVILAFSLLLNFVGEKNALVNLLLFFPPLPLLLPAFILFPLCLKYFRHLCWIPIGVVFFILLFQMHFRWSFWPAADKKFLSILTNNIGERRMRPVLFVKEEQPDVIVFQDASNRARALSNDNPGYFVAAQKQFIVLSKYEIKSSGMVPGMMHATGPVAAWFEIEYEGRPVVIYNVHMPTPRRDLERILRRGGIFSSASRDQYRRSLEARVKLVQQLLEFLKSEKRPFVVAGDFNMPDTGWLYRQCTSQMIDAFALAGRGYGYTFPGVTHNPLALFQPWLRIDYIFAGKDWKPLYCRVEPRQPAQHRAVSARFELSLN